MNRVIIFVDIVKSVDAKVAQGDAEANRMIQQRLQDIESALRLADPTVQRSIGQGDGILLLGTDPVILFHAAVMLQGGWISWPVGRAAKLSLGMGEFEETTDGDFRGSAIDLASRILSLCPEGGVVVTESIRACVQSAGFAGKLIRLEAELKGFGQEVYYEADGKYIPSEGSRQPAVVNVKQPARITFEAMPRSKFLAGAQGRSTDEPHARVTWNAVMLWRTLTIIALLGVVALGLFVVVTHGK